MNILLSSAGRRVELLRIFQTTLRTLGMVGNVIAVDTEALAPTLHLADRSYIVPRINDPNYINTLLQICQQEQVDLLFPTIDTELPLYSVALEQFKEIGTDIVISSPLAVHISQDKWETYQFFKRHGITTPNSWLPEQLAHIPRHFPLFIKPRFGSSSENTFKIESEEQLQFFSRYVPQAIIQEFISGYEVTNDIICDLRGQLLEVVSRRRITTRCGEVARGVTLYSPFARACAERLNKLLQFRGVVTLQYMMQGDVPYFTEINARLGGGAPLSVVAGANFAEWFIMQKGNLPFTLPDGWRYREGVYFSRYDESYTMNETQYHAMESRHI